MPESLKVEHEVEHEVDPEQHAAEVGVMPHQDALGQWQNWKRKPGPESMAKVLNSVRPIINKSVSKFPKYNSAILGGEAKRLAIVAIKTFDPDRGHHYQRTFTVTYSLWEGSLVTLVLPFARAV